MALHQAVRDDPGDRLPAFVRALMRANAVTSTTR